MKILISMILYQFMLLILTYHNIVSITIKKNIFVIFKDKDNQN